MIEEYDKIRPVPDTPQKEFLESSSRPPTKAATPDLILFNEAEVPIEFMTDLLFEQIGGIEILNIARTDLINGQDLTYNLIANSAILDKIYSSNNLFKVPGNTNEIFDNFPINFLLHVPPSGTAPSKFYVGAKDSFGCSGFPVLRKTDDTVVGCFQNIRDAEIFVDAAANPDAAYIDEETGDLVVDIFNISKNNIIQIDILTSGNLEDDTIY